jgi:hypothetical protein
VIQRIIAGGDQIILLVLDREGDDYYKSKGNLQQQPLLLPPVQVVVALSARIFLISQISCLLPHHLNSLGWLELHVEKKMIEKRGEISIRTFTTKL